MSLIDDHFMQANQIEKLSKRMAQLEEQLDKMLIIERGCLETIDKLNDKVVKLSARLTEMEDCLFDSRKSMIESLPD